MKAKFGSAAYAMEELRAEHSTLLTAALLSAIVPTLFPELRPIMIDGHETATCSPVEQLDGRSCLLGRRSRWSGFVRGSSL
jgi:hypothetical protein